MYILTNTRLKTCLLGICILAHNIGSVFTMLSAQQADLFVVVQIIYGAILDSCEMKVATQENRTWLVCVVCFPLTSIGRVGTFTYPK